MDGSGMREASSSSGWDRFGVWITKAIRSTYSRSAVASTLDWFGKYRKHIEIKCKTGTQTQAGSRCVTGCSFHPNVEEVVVMGHGNVLLFVVFGERGGSDVSDENNGKEIDFRQKFSLICGRRSTRYGTIL
eukprot:scaffold1139_cov174-Amphora_coffeaeformis.AAC.4